MIDKNKSPIHVCLMNELDSDTGNVLMSSSSSNY